MKAYFKYIGIFVAGAVFYQLSIMFLLSTASNNKIDVATYYGKEQSGYSVETDYFKSELSEVCEYLEGQGCLCKPRVETNISCKQSLNEFINKKSMHQLMKDHGINEVKDKIRNTQQPDNNN